MGEYKSECSLRDDIFMLLVKNKDLTIGMHVLGASCVTNFLRKSSILMLGWVCLLVSSLGSLNAAQKLPNVVFVMLDDLGYTQIEAFSHGLTEDEFDPALLGHVNDKGDYSPSEALAVMRSASPTISRLADEGVKFTNAMACSNLCAPARIGIATGILQNRWGMYRNIDVEAAGLRPNSHLAERLQVAGYATAHIGKWHIGGRDHDMVDRILKENSIETNRDHTYWSLGKDYPELKEALRLGGYEGSVVEKDHPLRNGFDYYFGYNQWECPFYNSTNVWEDFSSVGLIREYNTDVFTNQALEFMERSLESEKPFYVQLHYHAVHHPLDPRAPDRYYNRFDSKSHTLNNFYAHVYGVDENIRRVIEFLDLQGELENTLIVFTSDNGGAVGNDSCLPGNAPYSGHKGMLLQGGFRVPLLFYWKGEVDLGREQSQLVSTLDILPTILDAAGIPLPQGLDGQSLLPQILSDSDAAVRSHFVHGGIHARVWAFHGATSFFTHNVSREKAPSGYIVMDDRYILRFVSDIVPNLYRDAVDGMPAQYELYDYLNDPLEQNNLYQDLPEKSQELIEVWERESAAFPRPNAWGLDKWQAIVGSEVRN